MLARLWFFWTSHLTLLVGRDKASVPAADSSKALCLRRVHTSNPQNQLTGGAMSGCESLV